MNFGFFAHLRGPLAEGQGAARAPPTPRRSSQQMTKTCQPAHTTQAQVSPRNGRGLAQTRPRPPLVRSLGSQPLMRGAAATERGEGAGWRAYVVKNCFAGRGTRAPSAVHRGHGIWFFLKNKKQCGSPRSTRRWSSRSRRRRCAASPGRRHRRGSLHSTCAGPAARTRSGKPAGLAPYAPLASLPWRGQRRSGTSYAITKYREPREPRMATAEARGGTAALAPASQRASEIQRVLRDAREARERAGQAKWTSNTGLTRGTHGTQDLHLHTKTASTNPTSPPPVPPAPRPASTNPTPPPSAAPEKLGLGAVGLDLPKLQHNVSAPSHTGTPGDEAEQRAVREQVLSLQQQVSALQQAAKQAGSRPAASTAEASDTAAAAVQELISHEPQKRLSREEVLDVLETEDGTCSVPPVFGRSMRNRCVMRPCEDGRASLCP